MLKAKRQVFVTARVEMGWSCTELAQRTGMSPSGISRIERGCGVSEKSAKQISIALNKSVFELFEITLPSDCSNIAISC